MFVNFRSYKVPAGAKTRSRQIGFGGAATHLTLEELGVTEAYHFGSFAAGEMLSGFDRDGREITFLVDYWTSDWVEVST